MKWGIGGEDGIRTHETLLEPTPLAGERLQPLGHLSEAGNIPLFKELSTALRRSRKIDRRKTKQEHATVCGGIRARSVQGTFAERHYPA